MDDVDWRDKFLRIRDKSLNDQKKIQEYQDQVKKLTTKLRRDVQRHGSVSSPSSSADKNRDLPGTTLHHKTEKAVCKKTLKSNKKGFKSVEIQTENFDAQVQEKLTKQLKGKLQLLEQNLSRLKEEEVLRSKELAESHEKELQEVESSSISIESKWNDLENSLKDKRAQLEILQTRLNHLENTSSEHQLVLKLTKDKLRKSQEEALTLAMQNQKLAYELGTLKDKQCSMDSLREEIASLETENEKLSASLTKDRSLSLALGINDGEDPDAYANEIRMYQMKNATLEEHKNVLEKQLMDCKGALDLLGRNHTRLKKSMSTLEEKNGMLSERLQSVILEREEKKQRIFDLERKLSLLESPELDLDHFYLEHLSNLVRNRERIDYDEGEGEEGMIRISGSVKAAEERTTRSLAKLYESVARELDEAKRILKTKAQMISDYERTITNLDSEMETMDRNYRRQSKHQLHRNQRLSKEVMYWKAVSRTRTTDCTTCSHIVLNDNETSDAVGRRDESSPGETNAPDRATVILELTVQDFCFSTSSNIAELTHYVITVEFADFAAERTNVETGSHPFFDTTISFKLVVDESFLYSISHLDQRVSLELLHIVDLHNFATIAKGSISLTNLLSSASGSLKALNVPFHSTEDTSKNVGILVVDLQLQYPLKNILEWFELHASPTTQFSEEKCLVPSCSVIHQSEQKLKLRAHSITIFDAQTMKEENLLLEYKVLAYPAVVINIDIAKHVVPESHSDHSNMGIELQRYYETFGIRVEDSIVQNQIVEGLSLDFHIFSESEHSEGTQYAAASIPWTSLVSINGSRMEHLPVIDVQTEKCIAKLVIEIVWLVY